MPKTASEPERKNNIEDDSMSSLDSSLSSVPSDLCPHPRKRSARAAPVAVAVPA